MRILQYNILDGCQDNPERLARLGAWLQAQAADVVGLNELNGWDAQTYALAGGGVIAPMQSGQPPIPEPAALGLTGLALLALRSGRRLRLSGMPQRK